MKARDAYKANTEELFKFLVEHNIAENFCKMLTARAEITARDMVGVNDPNLMFALKGQISICYELVDGAMAALETEKAKANASIAKGHLPIPTTEF